MTRAAALVLAVLAVATLAVPTPSRAAEEEGAVTVVLERVSPTAPTAGATLTVLGRVRNTGLDALRGVDVELRVNREPLQTRGQVSAIAGGDRTVRGAGAAYARREVTEELRAGGETRFSVDVPVDELPLDDFGVYVLTVRVTTPDGPVGEVRTFLAWQPEEANVTPTRIAWLWPLVDQPHRLADGVFADDRLAAELDENGRLGRLLAAPGAAGTPVTFVVDPMLLEDLDAMGRGYVVRAGKRTETGLGGGRADDAIAQLRNLATAGRVTVLPYGAPDATALVHARLPGELRRTADHGAAVAAVLGPRVGRDLAWPVGGAADLSTAAALRAAGAGAIVLTGSSLPPAEEVTYTPTGRATLPDGTDVLLADDALSALAAATPTSGDQAVLAQQRWLAETAMVTAERPSPVRGAPRTLLVAPPHDWSPTAAWATFLLRSTRAAPWLEPVDVAAMRATPVPEVERSALRYADTARRRELSARYLAIVRTVAVENARFARVLSAPTTLTRKYELAVWRLYSASLRTTDARARVSNVQELRSALARDRSAIQVVPGDVVLGARSGPIPVTIRNDLDQSVTVLLVLQPRSARLTIRKTAPITIGANRIQQVDVAAEALASGLEVVDVRLQTPDGSPYAGPVAMRVRVTEYGTVAAYITTGAAVALFLAAGLQLARRTRAARRGRVGQ